VQQQSKIDEAYWSEEFESVTTQLNQDEREKARARERERQRVRTREGERFHYITNYDSNYHLCKYDMLAEGAVNSAMKGLMFVTVLNGQGCHCE